MSSVQTLAKYKAKEILEKVDNDATFEVKVDGRKIIVKLSSLRLRTFQKSQTCVCCGRVGNVLGLDLPKGHTRPHFNLYCDRPENGENMILMTKDHIIPKSKGGKNHISNMQTMCCHCNRRKADMSPEEFKKNIHKIRLKSTEKQLISV